MKLSFLYGIRGRDWWRLLRENRFAVSPRAWPHAALITVLSLHNSLMARRDRRVDLSGVTVKPPIFVLGHWRSGTTHLHYLLGRDSRFATPNVYTCAYPWGFLSNHRAHRRLIERLAPRERAQDGVPMGLAAPQEDELALACMTLRSPYMGWLFPQQADRYLPYLSFESAPEAHRAEFERGLLEFVRKLSHRNPGKNLVLKSPAHTARIPLLLRLFPEAKFVHVVRDPYAVYQSTLNFYRVWYRQFAFLQKADLRTAEPLILKIYRETLCAYVAEKHLLPPGRIYEMRYEDLERDPLGEMNRLYRTIGLGEVPGEVHTYLQRLGRHRKNRYAPLDPATRARVSDAWGFAFRQWGYAT